MSSTIQRSFAAGEVAPALYSRVDTVKYATGLRTLRNLFVMRHGGAASRPGTELVGEVKDSTKTVRLIPFVFNTDQTYVLEFGNLYMRVIKDGAQLTLTAQMISGISAANPGVLTYVGSDTYAAGDMVVIDGITGSLGPYLNGRTFKVGTVTGAANTFNLLHTDGTNFDTSALPAYSGSHGTVAEIYKIATLYTEAELPDIRFVQSADTITIVHPDHVVRELTRSAHTSWTLTDVTFAPTAAAPTGLSLNAGAGAASLTAQVCSIDDETGEESLAATATDATADLSGTWTISWTPASGCTYSRVYALTTGGFGFMGIGTSAATFPSPASGLKFPDTSIGPPVSRDPFSGSSNYPSAVTYYQQRLCLANTDNNTEGVWTSQSGIFHNFTKHTPLQDSDAITFAMTGSQVNEVKHLLGLSKLIIFTESGEWIADGDSAGIITPTQINLKQQSFNGASDLAPIVIDGIAVYVQARGQIVRDLAFEFQSDGYRGNDLTIFSAHLVDGYELVDWAYQKVPHSVVWAVRDDGVLLSMTYVREQQIVGWAKHDTDGLVENVVVVPEGTEDAVYVVVNRDDTRYIERFTTRAIDDIVDYKGMDNAITYDGRYDTTTVTDGSAYTATQMLSGGTTWAYDETLTLTASHVWSVDAVSFGISAITQANPAVVTTTAPHGLVTGDIIYFDVVDGMVEVAYTWFKVTVTAADTFSLQTLAGVNVDSSAYTGFGAFGAGTRISGFSAADVGNEIHLTGSDDELIRFTITGYTSALVVTGRANRTVPASLRSTAAASWAKAVDTITGLWHLEGQDVSVLGDGLVVANPNNESYDVVTVANGSITLDDCYAVVHVGLPYFCDLQTLDLASTQSVAENKRKMVQQVNMQVEDTRGVWVGAAPPTDDSDDPLEGLTEMKLRNDEDYDDPVSLATDNIDILIRPEWNSNGRVFVRQVDPVPMTILSVVPAGFSTVGGQ